ncbi:hypothetical protein YB2330_004470, partial [Saitoella coloradoensis]
MAYSPLPETPDSTADAPRIDHAAFQDALSLVVQYGRQEGLAFPQLLHLVQLRAAFRPELQNDDLPRLETQPVVDPAFVA